MSTIDEIRELEERLRQAELTPDAAFFEEHLADDVLDGQRLKARVVEAHRPENGQKFTNVEMADLDIREHGCAAVVSCVGRYVSRDDSFRLRFMRVWIKEGGRWRIVAGTTAAADEADR